MGIFHFMGVGKAVGAVTCAVDYIEKSLDLMEQGNEQPELTQLFCGSGGINHKESSHGKIEAIVLFSSSEVINGDLKAFCYKGNTEPESVRDEIEKNLEKRWKRTATKKGRRIFWVEVDIDNFQDCFEKAMKVAYRFSPPGKQGKEIWINLTGGANSINLALMTMARLTGVSTKHYLISQREDYRQEISVPSEITIQPNKDNYFNTIPFVKIAVDTVNFYELLMELNELDKAVTGVELLARIQSKRTYFADFNKDKFHREYLLKLYGLGYTDYTIEKDEIMITPSGRDFINDLDRLDIALELENDLIENKLDIVEKSKEWEWFHSPVTLK